MPEGFQSKREVRTVPFIRLIIAAFNRWMKFQNTNIRNGKMMSADKENLHSLSDDEVKRLKNEATNEVGQVLNQLEKDYPGITDGAAAMVGSGVGAAGSLAALSALGVPGLSAAGITSGLAAAGALVGGGMVAGIGVLAAPIAILGIGGYAIAKKRRSAKLAAALAQAIGKLYNVQNRLMANAEYFKEEIAGIKATIDLLTLKKPA